MKKKIFGFAIAVILTAAAHAQGIRLNAYANYVFDDKVDSYYSTSNYFNGTIKGGLLWGGGLEFRLKDYYGIELMYLRLDTHAPMNYWLGTGEKTANLKLASNYILVNGVRTFPTHNPKVEPFGGLGLGMAIIDAENPQTGNSGNATKFAWDVRLGSNFWVSEKVGIKIQTMLLSVPQGAGGGLYFGTGGVGAGVTTYSSIYQFVLGGGLVFKLGSHK